MTANVIEISHVVVYFERFGPLLVPLSTYSREPKRSKCTNINHLAVSFIIKILVCSHLHRVKQTFLSVSENQSDYNLTHRFQITLVKIFILAKLFIFL